MPYRDLEKKPEALNSYLVLAAAALFSAVAGFVNLVLLEATRMTLSHMTGNVARLSEALFRGSEISSLHFLVIIFCFLFGAMLTGFVLADQHFGPRRLYGALMIVEGLVLLIAAAAFENSVWTTVYLVSFAMGQQNAMASSFKGLIVRTTHMTGILTDLGFLLGSFLKTRRFVYWRVGFFMILLSGFFMGGWLGLISYQTLKIKSLFFPGSILLILGLFDILYIYNLNSRSHNKA